MPGNTNPSHLTPSFLQKMPKNTNPGHVAPNSLLLYRTALREWDVSWWWLKFIYFIIDKENQLAQCGCYWVWAPRNSTRLGSSVGTHFGVKYSILSHKMWFKCVSSVCCSLQSRFSSLLEQGRTFHCLFPPQQVCISPWSCSDCQDEMKRIKEL